MMRRCELPARDLRLLDPLFVYPSTVLGRERTIVVNLEQIRSSSPPTRCSSSTPSTATSSSTPPSCSAASSSAPRATSSPSSFTPLSSPSRPPAPSSTPSYISRYKNRFHNFIKHLREIGDEKNSTHWMQGRRWRVTHSHGEEQHQLKLF
ncbi:magnesium transporter MRS2-F-like isoform X2 [Triticum urartu]|uniref:magnesium transporter MRS2-F-like isoform X2 n=1 Tax=Triticum urartu TaxID=4572 RepID=UPI0020433AA2|nr:magnesium transporter MRS2-F-like isoform X2 [Triticum urartu]